MEIWVKIRGMKGATRMMISQITFCLFKGIKRMLLTVS